MMNNSSALSARFKAFALMLALSAVVTAQRRGNQTVVMNDGTWVTGTIVADSGSYLKVRVKTPQVITLRKSDVFSWNPALLVRSRANQPEQLISPFTEGYFIRLSGSVLGGRNEYGRTGTLSLHFSNGYEFRNGLSLGIGAGIEEFEAAVMPVYTDLRFHPLNCRVSPFLWLKSGIGIPLGDAAGGGSYPYGYYPDVRAGAMFNAGTGIALYTGKNNGVNVAVGYRFQRLTFRQTNYWGQHTDNEIVTDFNRFEVQFGFIFR